VIDEPKKPFLCSECKTEIPRELWNTCPRFGGARFHSESCRTTYIEKFNAGKGFVRVEK
jgi:hypothetical protein